jgi:hypothetical protein
MRNLSLAFAVRRLAAVRRPDGGVRSAFSLAETLMCMLLVGTVLVASLYTVGDATIARQATGDRGVGQLLAQDLISEILRLPYQDPDQTPIMGAEGGESTGNRSSFDDIDDFHMWTQTPPVYIDGCQVGDLNCDGMIQPELGEYDLSDWTRTAKVERVAAGQLTASGDAGSETGIKRITVDVLYKFKPTARLITVRTDGASAATDTEFDVILVPGKPSVE